MDARHEPPAQEARATTVKVSSALTYIKAVGTTNRNVSLLVF